MDVIYVKDLSQNGVDLISAYTIRVGHHNHFETLVKMSLLAKREEERVAELKRIRGERWLPSIAKEMQLKASRLTHVSHRFTNSVQASQKHS